MTEKDYNPEQKNKKVIDNPKAVAKTPVNKEPKKTIAESQSDSENKEVINKKDSGAIKVDTGNDKKETTPKGVPRKTSGEVSTKGKKPVVKTEPKVKKNEAVVKGVSLPLSTKTTVAVCRFIRGKNIQKAISDLEQVIGKKKAVPMKGEIPHRKGKIMSGRFPGKTAEYFIKLLKNLQANANVNGLENPVIVEAMANLASQPYGKFGRVRRKRSHVTIRVKEKVKKKAPKGVPRNISKEMSTRGKKVNEGGKK